jgi:AraC family transcriptional regulator of adaptative response / DNA-3-methyladenine glycosylase II
VRHHGHQPALTLGLQLSASDRLMAIVERVRRIFDLNANMQAIHGILQRDPLLAKAITKHPGLRLPGAWDPFEIALRAMVGQQISVKAARTVCSRLVTRAGREVAGGGDEKLTHYFPTAGELLRTDLAQMGLTNKRREYLTNLCRAVDSGAMQLTVGGTLSDCLERLTALPGIGPWTANYIAMRALGEPDAFPAEDLGILKGLGGDKKRPSRKEVLARAEAWRPWRAYAAIYLWSLD